jgi:hypothetical protein
MREWKYGRTDYFKEYFRILKVYLRFLKTFLRHITILCMPGEGKLVNNNILVHCLALDIIYVSKKRFSLLSCITHSVCTLRKKRSNVKIRLWKQNLCPVKGNGPE